MKTTVINRVGFDEVFYFAEKYFNIGWNDCCELFLNKMFTYGSITQIYMSDVKHNFTYGKDVDKLNGEHLLEYIINFRGTDISKLSSEDQRNIVVLNFMFEHEIDDMEVDSR